ncbi:serine/threonine-protein kinase [Chondromyces apiculatus]|uniref:Serine/threonine protein kinase n=1 Tax=Chondromyces apiculatus DSM 436 TaxID=1192034 RepID=A0A017T3W3_9BACT|nr:serine/threonine-protein kinase [Chondromyces apiculatus]EYF03672.1 serine/threonine protein kinase [Chondromyces apiculatus DSM 436]
MAFRPGDVIGDRYEVEEMLGQGGQGAVYRGTDTVLGSQVAIKCLHPQIASEPGFKTRFLREARTMGALSGTSAVQVFDIGKIEGGGMYIVMELVDGQNFEQYLRSIEEAGSHIPLAKLWEIIDPLVATLEVAHARGIIHRDLKPGNIMVMRSQGRGPARLLDFGLAKDLKADPLTLDGMVTGSPSYIAPEAWMGKQDVIDHRVDVYALGTILFRALAGVHPFDARKALFDLVFAVTRGPRPSLHERRPDLSPAIDGWVARALAVDPNARHQNVRALWTDFQLRLTGRPA